MSFYYYLKASGLHCSGRSWESLLSSELNNAILLNQELLSRLTLIHNPAVCLLSSSKMAMHHHSCYSSLPSHLIEFRIDCSSSCTVLGRKEWWPSSGFPLRKDVWLSFKTHCFQVMSCPFKMQFAERQWYGSRWKDLVVMYNLFSCQELADILLPFFFF